MMSIVDNMRRKAANWPSPHVRRITPFIDLVMSGLDKLGIEPWQSSARQIEFDYNGKRYRVGYGHPHRSPRQSGGISIWRIEGNSKVLVRRFEKIEQASIFCLHPMLDDE